jgi:hypothetical protein
MARQVSLRLPDYLYKRAAKLLKTMQASSAYAGINLTVSRVLIVAVARGLEVLEAEHNSKRRK